MLYTICIGLVLVASVLMILAVLVQSPKSGMAANFGASNQVMGVRQTTDFLEKFTWTMAIAIFAISLMATVASGSVKSGAGAQSAGDSEAMMKHQIDQTTATMPQAEAPAAAEEVIEPVEENVVAE